MLLGKEERMKVDSPRHANYSFKQEIRIMQTLEPVLKEFLEECAITQRVLDRLPADKLTWKPHRKSMSLGALALHIATVPGALARISQLDEFDAAQANFNPPEPKNLEEIKTAFQESIQAGEDCLGGMT
jgi:uncharacterized damage-inducible protein DinB